MSLVVKIGADLSDFEKKMNKATKEIRSLGDKLGSIGSSLSTKLTLPLVGFAAAAVAGTEEIRGELAKLETNAEQAGESMERLEEAHRDVYAVTGDLASSTEGLSNLLASGFKGNEMQRMMENLAGAAIKFKDTLKFEGLADGLQETLATGEAIGPFAELLERSGVALDGFNKGLQTSIERGNEQQYVLSVLANQGLADVYKQYKKNNEALIESKNSQYEFQRALQEIGEKILPIITKVTTAVTTLLEKFNSLDPTLQNIILIVAGLVAALGPLISMIAFGITLFGKLSAAAGILGVSLSAIAAPVAIAIAAIIALITIGTLLYKHWDEIKTAFINLWETIVEGVVEQINKLINYVESSLNSIIQFINGFISKINSVIEKINKIPGLNLNTVSTLESMSFSRLEVASDTKLPKIANNQQKADIKVDLDGRTIASAIGQPLANQIRVSTGLKI